MGNPVWTGSEAGSGCAARQCSRLDSGFWILRSRTLALHLPCPDPVHKVAHRFFRRCEPCWNLTVLVGLCGFKEYVLFPPHPPVAHHPGKCMSQTNSTFTFTTCRILHPSDELTRVTPR